MISNYSRYLLLVIEVDIKHGTSTNGCNLTTKAEKNKIFYLNRLAAMLCGPWSVFGDWWLVAGGWWMHPLPTTHYQSD